MQQPNQCQLGTGLQRCLVVSVYQSQQQRLVVVVFSGCCPGAPGGADGLSGIEVVHMIWDHKHQWWITGVCIFANVCLASRGRRKLLFGQHSMF